MSVPSIPTVILSLVWPGPKGKYPSSGPKLGAVAGSTQPLAAKVRLCCAATIPSCGGKLVRRIGISHNPRHASVISINLVLMRVSHRQRDRQVDLCLIQLRIWAVWSSVGGIDHQHQPPSLTIKPLEATAPKPGMSR